MFIGVLFLLFIFLGKIFNWPSSSSKEKIISYNIANCADHMKKYHAIFFERNNGVNTQKNLKNFSAYCNSYALKHKLLECKYNAPQCYSGASVFPILMDENPHHGVVNILMSDRIIITVPANKIDDSIIFYIKHADDKYIPFQAWSSLLIPMTRRIPMATITELTGEIRIQETLLNFR